jgi:hypothetical protein
MALFRSHRWLILAGLLCVCAAARGQSNSVSIGITNLIVQGELNQFKSSLPFHIVPAPAYVFSIAGNVHGEGPIFSALVPASEPASTAFEAIHTGLSSGLSGSVSNPGSAFPSTILSELVSSGTDGEFNATFSLSIDANGVVSFAITNVALVINGQPDTTDRLVFDSGNVTVTALFPDVSVATLSATNITIHGATLSSSILCPNNFQAYFVYSPNTTYSSTSSKVSIVTSGSAQTILIPVTGLLPHQVYHFAAVAADVTGPAYGHGLAFETADTPPQAGNISAFAGLSPLDIPALTYCSDADGDTLKVTSVTNATAGKAAVKSGGAGVTYQFTSRTVPSDHFTYTISDGFGGSATGQVNVVNYATLAGTYSAVLLNPASGGAGAGLLRVTLTPTGYCSGSVTVSGSTYSFSGGLDSSGHYFITVNSSAPLGTTVTLDMVQSGSGYQLSAGVAMNALRLVASLPPAAPALAGNYTMAIPPPPRATWAGSGYALVGIASSGLATISGALPDGAPFSCQAAVDAAGRMGVFSLLYAASNRGTLAGTLSVATSASMSGTLVWTKPAFSTAGINQGPFSISLTGSGGPYVVPSHAAALQFGTAENSGKVVLSAGNLNTPIQNQLVMAANSSVTILGQNSPALALAIQPATGLFTGHFVDPLTGQIRTIHGALLQGARGGAGYFLGDSTGGAVGLGP